MMFESENMKNFLELLKQLVNEASVQNVTRYSDGTQYIDVDRFIEAIDTELKKYEKHT